MICDGRAQRGHFFLLSTHSGVDFSLSTNRDLDFYRVHFQGYILALFCDTLDETSHCGRYPATVQSRVHFMINL